MPWWEILPLILPLTVVQMIGGLNREGWYHAVRERTCLEQWMLHAKAHPKC